MVLATLRTLVFYSVFFVPFTVLWSVISVTVGLFLPVRLRYQFIVGTWARVTVFASRWLLGIRYRVSGLEHLSGQVGVVVANHQSTWETFFLQTLFYPQTQVIKQSLLNIPFFGWAFALSRPIAIDRSNGNAAIAQILEQGVERLNAGVFVLIFPEGTRADPHQIKRFQKGGALLAQAAKVPMIPVAHNSGDYWLNKRFVKLPGVIDVVIHPPVDTSQQTPEAAIKMAQATITDSLAKMPRRISAGKE